MLEGVRLKELLPGLLPEVARSIFGLLGNVDNAEDTIETMDPDYIGLFVNKLGPWLG